jgi:hypothetical protein
MFRMPRKTRFSQIDRPRAGRAAPASDSRQVAPARPCEQQSAASGRRARAAWALRGGELPFRGGASSDMPPLRNGSGGSVGGARMGLGVDLRVRHLPDAAEDALLANRSAAGRACGAGQRFAAHCTCPPAQTAICREWRRARAVWALRGGELPFRSGASSDMPPLWRGAARAARRSSLEARPARASRRRYGTTGVTTPRVIATSCSYFSGKTVCACPAAAQISG